MFRFIYLLLSFLMMMKFSACKTEGKSVSDLIGGWRWVESNGALVGYSKETPENTKKNTILIFRQDSICIQLLNGDTVQVSRFSIQNKTQKNDLFIYSIFIEPLPNAHLDKGFRGTLMLKEDTLILSKEQGPGYVSKYCRIKS